MADLTREERNRFHAIIAALAVACAIMFTGATVYCVRCAQARQTSETLMLHVSALEDDKDILDERIMATEAMLRQAYDRISELEAEKEELTRRWEESSFALDEIVNETGWTQLGTFKLTFYCPCERCCGKWANGITATGTTAAEGRTIAVDPKVIPLGSEVRINGHTYIAEDTGVSGRTIDVFVNDHQEALRLGVQHADVEWRTI